MYTTQQRAHDGSTIEEVEAIAAVVQLYIDGCAQGNAAKLEGFWGTLSFVDFLTLSRSDGRWRIVNKTFAHTGGEMPAAH